MVGFAADATGKSAISVMFGARLFHPASSRALYIDFSLLAPLGRQAPYSQSRFAYMLANARRHSELFAAWSKWRARDWPLVQVDAGSGSRQTAGQKVVWRNEGIITSQLKISTDAGIVAPLAEPEWSAE